MVNETWFKEAIKDAPDLFVLAGHMPVSNDNWPSASLALGAVRALTYAHSRAQRDSRGAPGHADHDLRWAHTHP
jgi:hypothetical protein